MNERLEYYCKAISEEKKEKFDLFFRTLVEFNKMFNLTSITERNEVFFKHFIDSAAGEFLFREGASLCEVGSGAGFPSLALKILREDLEMTLIESTGKKCEFLKAIVDKLSFSGVKVENARAEDLAKNPFYREKFDYCTARAVARLNTLSEYCLPFVKKGGKFIAYKGEASEETKEAERAVKILGGKISSVYEYDLFSYGKRSLIVVDKISSTPEKYPRGNGRERKQPL